MIFPVEIWESLCEAASLSTIEVCGGLFGKIIDNEIKVFEWRLQHNAAQGVNAFAIDINSLCCDVMNADGDPLRLLGLFHSHPEGEPILSPMDKYYMGLTSLIWVVVGKGGVNSSWEIRAYAKINGRSNELSLQKL